MSEELKDYTSLNISEFLVAETSVLTEYAQTDALAFDQAFEGVPGGNIIFGGMQIRKKKYSDTTTAGVWVGVDTDGVGKINIGDDTNFLLWNGSALVISGDITATSGTIGGWTIGSTTLTGGGVTLDSAGIITGGVIQTSETGKRVVLNGVDNEINFYDSSNTNVGNIYGSTHLIFQSSGGDIITLRDGALSAISTMDLGRNTAAWVNLYLSGDISMIGGTVFAFDFQGDNVEVDSSIILHEPVGSQVVRIEAASMTSDWTLTLPTTNGTSGQYLQTNGSGVTTWSSVTSGASTSLDNLSSTEINSDLDPDGDTTRDLGEAANRWGSVHALIVQLNGGGYIDDARAIYFEQGRTTNPTIEGEVRFYDGGSVNMRVYLSGTNYNFDLTAA